MLSHRGPRRGVQLASSVVCALGFLGVTLAHAQSPSFNVTAGASALGVPLDLPAVGLLVWGSPSRWGLLSVTHRPADRWIPRGGDPVGVAFLGDDRDRHAVVACDLDRDGVDEVLASVGSRGGEGDNSPELWWLD